MKVLQVNSVCGYGSTGRIAADLADILHGHGHECRIAYGRGTAPEQYRDITVRIGNDWDVRWHGLMTRLFDSHGFHSKAATKGFLDWVREYDPDVIHLHNIHGYYLNVELLFAYLKAAGKPVIWTLHDCWAFTGHCSHFAAVRCEQWRKCCMRCVQKGRYPKCVFCSDVSCNFERKRTAFTDVPNLTLVSPSNWLTDLTRESFLREYPVCVIHNGIDLDVFRPTKGDFREQHGLRGKKLALGVASVWDERKGLGDLIALSRMLGDDWRVVLVGLTEKQCKGLPANVVGIRRTNNARELAELYTAANVFVNPTKEEVLGLVNIEALACGTPVITYRSGGSPEVIDESCGIVVEQSVEALGEAVKKADFPQEACLHRAESFEKNTQFEKYLHLYEDVENGR